MIAKPGRIGLLYFADDKGRTVTEMSIIRFAEDDFMLITAATAQWHDLAWLERHLPEGSGITITDRTEDMGTFIVAGPKSRDHLAPLTDADLTQGWLTHQNATIAGKNALLIRVSFTGELSFEINVPSRHGPALWTALMAAGAAFDITPYGTETMHVLRAEKGFIIVGQETDGSVSPNDLGMDWIVSKTKADFIGKRGLARADLARGGRKQLVGLLASDPAVVLPEGAQIVEAVTPQPPMAMIGHVTSSYHSVTCGRSIALALVADGRERIGEPVSLPLADKTLTAEVTAPQFFDPEGARLDG